mgnify:CR=1 FL=1|tara:strand:+ start:692 stop:1471 length:780 start_codon:yes stop_codon:yes gene_type:complete
MIIAITNCKAMKQDYACSVDEMYSKSYVYRAQRGFFTKAYDKYLIFSAKYGLLTPTREIEPYDLALESKIGRVNVTNAITKEQKEQLFEKVEQQLIQLFELADEIHFHTSHIYYAPFEKIFKKYPLFSNKLRRIGQQKNPPVAQRKYEEATQIYDGNNLEQCLTHISTINKGVPEYENIWYHNQLAPKGIGPYKAHQVRKWVQDNYPNEKIDEGSLHKVSLSKIEQTYGWVINREYLPYLVQYPNSSWRFNKKQYGTNT